MSELINRARRASDSTWVSGKYRMRVLAGGVSLLALTCSQSVSAQSESERRQVSNSSGLEEVVVTARRVEESLQKVPITIQAFGKDQLDVRDVRGIDQLDRAFTGMTFSTLGGAGLGRSVARGVQGVAAYFGGAPTLLMGRALFFDIANVQALAGPQGTLFGVATNGGAVVIEPKKPAENFEGFVEGTAGDYGRLGISGVVNVPVSDKLQIRAGGTINRRDGYVLDLTSGLRHGTDNYEYGRVQIRFRPDDRFENVLLAQFDHSHGLKDPLVPYLLNPTGPAARIYGQAFVTRVLANIAMGPYQYVGALSPVPPHYESNNYNVVNTTTFRLNDQITLKNIFSWTGAEEAADEGDMFGSIFTGYPGFGNGLPFGPGLRADGTRITPYKNPGYAEAKNEEFQVLGNFTKLNFVVGTFNSWTGNPHPLPVLCFANFGALTCNNNFGRGALPTSQPSITGTGETHAVYGQGTYDLSEITEGLSFTAGVRWTHDQIAYPDQITLNPATLAVIPALSGDQGPVSFNKVSYHLNLQYQISPSTLIYVSDSKGYSKGGFNGLNVPVQFQAFSPETLDSYETGLKSDFQTGTWNWRSNVSVYYGRFNNVQVLTQQLLNNTLTQATTNAAKARTWGVQTDIAVRPVQSFELSTSVGYNEINYTKYLFQTSVNPPVFQDRKKQRFILAPRWKFNLSGTYDLPMEAFTRSDVGQISVMGSWSFASTVCNSAALIPAPTIANGSCFPNRNVVDAVLKWSDLMARKGLELSFHVTNITNNKFTEGNGPTYSTLGFSGISLMPPRMYFFSLRQTF